MLTSITPLGERSRGFSWWLTASAFALGAVVAGIATGALLGLLGSLPSIGPGVRAALALATIALALSFDALPSTFHLPSSRRQVNEDWLTTYRGWIYGLGFGAQLGTGVVTIVTSAAVYAMWLLALLSGSALAGAALGAVFGLARALSLLPAGTVTDPARLLATGRALERWERRTRRLGPVLELVALIAVVAVIA